MSIPAASITAVYRRFSFHVKVDTKTVEDVFEVSCSEGFEQVNAQASLRMWYRPDWAEEGKKVEIWVYDQPNKTGNSAVLFNGEITNSDWEYGEGSAFKIECRGKLARLRNRWGGAERTYTSQDDAAVIRNLLEAHDIPSSDAHIESSGWTLGGVVDVVLAENDVAWDLIERIDKIAGFKTFERADGAIYRQQVVGAPSVRARWTYEKGVNIYRCTRSKRVEGIYNKVVVKGLEWEGTTIEAEASAPNAYLQATNPTNPYIADEITDDLIEDNTKAQAVATRYVSDKNRFPESFDLEIPGNPDIKPGITVKIIHPSVEVSDGLLFVDQVGHTAGSSGYVTTFRASAGPLSGYRLTPPIAAFTFDMKLEHSVAVDTTVSGVIVCVADASASSDTDSEEPLTYAWTAAATGATPTPTSGTAAQFYFTVPDTATVITVTLVVTDVDGLSTTLTRAYTIDTSQLSVEDLYTAEGTIVACSTDGEATWKEQTPPSGNATCLSPFASQRYQIWGTSTGYVYASFDKLRTTLLSFGQPNGSTAVNAVWIHETDDTRVWAATNDGKVYFGRVDTTAKTCAWTLQGTLPAAPYEIRESYGTLGELRATAGNNSYISQDSGRTWTLLKAGTGSARRMAAGWETNAASWVSDSAPVKYESGADPTFPVLSPVVNGINGLSFGWQDQELYAVDDQNPARSFLSDSTFATFTRKTDLGQQANHVLRSGNERRVVYAAVGDGVATGGGVQKSTDGLASWFYARRTGTRKVHMIGYGAAHLPETVSRVEFLRPTVGIANGGVWHYVPGTGWTLKNSGLPTGVIYSQWVSANPFNQNHWLLLLNTINSGQSFKRVGDEVFCDDSTTRPLWLTTDNGATWSAVTLTLLNSTVDFATLTIRNVEWSPTTSGQWFLCGHKQQVGGSNTSVVWRGSGTASTLTSTTKAIDSVITQAERCCAGLEDDIIVTEEASGSIDAGKLLNAATACIPLADHLPHASRPERAAGLYPALYGAESTSGPSAQSLKLFYLPDYRNGGSPQTIILSSRVSFVAAVATYGTVFCGGATGTNLTRQSVLKLSNFLTLAGGTSVTETVVAATVVTGTDLIGMVRSDRSTHTALVACVLNTAGAASGKDAFVSEDEGVTWTLVTGPGSAGNTDLANLVEVLKRSVVG